MTLDLDSIKARLAAATGARFLDAGSQDLIHHAKGDLAALVAEVERLRAAVERHRDEVQAVDVLVEFALADARLWAEVLDEA